jgi:hypothetical protein
MSDMTVTDPVQLAELQEQIAQMKATFMSLRQRETDRPKKGKVKEDLANLVKSDFPLITLSREKYKNKKGEVNESSLRSQFKQAAKDMELDFEPALVDDGTNLYLVNFDEDNAEAKFEQYILRTAGIATADLNGAARDLDLATK